MIRARIAVLAAGLALGAPSLFAQGTPPQKKVSTPARDSLKAVKSDLKRDKYAKAKAKASGDTAKARKLSKDIKQDKKKKAALKKAAGPGKKSTTTAPPKQP